MNFNRMAEFIVKMHIQNEPDYVNVDSVITTTEAHIKREILRDMGIDLL